MAVSLVQLLKSGFRENLLMRFIGIVTFATAALRPSLID
jgi:hypothetical protein